LRKGTGSGNTGSDEVPRPGSAEFDETKRSALLAKATKIAMDDAAILPMYWQKLYWAARKGFVVDADRGEASVNLIRLAP
jgi:peptide/nickel transport system substrate-binding protein